MRYPNIKLGDWSMDVPFCALHGGLLVLLV